MSIDYFFLVIFFKFAFCNGYDSSKQEPPSYHDSTYGESKQEPPSYYDSIYGESKQEPPSYRDSTHGEPKQELPYSGEVGCYQCLSLHSYLSLHNCQDPLKDTPKSNFEAINSYINSLYLKENINIDFYFLKNCIRKSNLTNYAKEYLDAKAKHIILLNQEKKLLEEEISLLSNCKDKDLEKIRLLVNTYNFKYSISSLKYSCFDIINMYLNKVSLLLEGNVELLSGLSEYLLGIKTFSNESSNLLPYEKLFIERKADLISLEIIKAQAEVKPLEKKEVIEEKEPEKDIEKEELELFKEIEKLAEDALVKELAKELLSKSAEVERAKAEEPSKRSRKAERAAAKAAAKAENAVKEAVKEAAKKESLRKAAKEEEEENFIKEIKKTIEELEKKESSIKLTKEEVMERLSSELVDSVGKKVISLAVEDELKKLEIYKLKLKRDIREQKYIEEAARQIKVIKEDSPVEEEIESYEKAVGALRKVIKEYIVVVIEEKKGMERKVMIKAVVKDAVKAERKMIKKVIIAAIKEKKGMEVKSVIKAVGGATKEAIKETIKFEIKDDKESIKESIKAEKNFIKLAVREASRELIVKVFKESVKEIEVNKLLSYSNNLWICSLNSSAV